MRALTVISLPAVVAIVALLLAEGKSATWVAYECGFADQSHLRRRFKECHGVTPGTFQAQYRAELNAPAAVESSAAWRLAPTFNRGFWCGPARPVMLLGRMTVSPGHHQRQGASVSKQGPLTEGQWAMFRSRMEELANPKPDAITSPVRDTYLAEVVLILMDRIDDLEQRLSRAAPTLSAVGRRRLDTLTHEDWDAFLANYGEYLMDGWDELRAFRTALGTLLVQLEQKQKQVKGRQKRA